MTIQERLRRYGYRSPPCTLSPRRGEGWGERSADSPPGRGEGWEERSDDPPDRLVSEFARCLDGRIVSHPDGPTWVVQRDYPLAHQHGNVALADLAAMGLSRLGSLIPALGGQETQLDQVAFFDTETTGLAGGTGTSVFLAGVGSFVESGFRVRQHFLPDPVHEPAFLAALSADLGRFRYLLTFNGARFDLPLLETRLILRRQRVDWGFVHVDLLHPARRLWRRTVSSCTLEALEREVLVVQRDADVPGWEIPARYFDYLRSRSLALLVPVFAHNRHDLVSLVALAGRMLGVAAGTHADRHRGAERFALAVATEERGQLEAAAALYEEVLATAEPSLQRDAYVRLGIVYRRLRQSERAVAVWEALLVATGGRSAVAAIELAKHYEHRERNYPRALELAELAGGLLGQWSSPRDRNDLAKRIARLRRVSARGTADAHR
ncbi:MAG: ribonuclease H-like domain-containing protein [Chloroflexi bacterium]|nr:ribonuclease H-like domain-containing protein [Chloroflexota bacterium]